LKLAFYRRYTLLSVYEMMFRSRAAQVFTCPEKCVFEYSISSDDSLHTNN